jgi:hypothetical protein
MDYKEASREFKKCIKNVVDISRSASNPFLSLYFLCNEKHPFLSYVVLKID